MRPNVQFDLGLAAQGLRVLYPQGMREGIDANLRLAGSTDNAVLNGSVNLSDVSFLHLHSILNNFISQFSSSAAAPPSQGFGRNLQLNVNVRSASSVNLVSRTLSIGGSANLQVRGTASNPVILGRVNLNSGDIILNGTRFLLNGGTVEFVNPFGDGAPVSASLSRLRFSNMMCTCDSTGLSINCGQAYSSDPALPSADIA